MDIRQKILQAAIKVYAESGFRGATTRRIAQEAGVNEITLFRQFGTKDALVKAALKVAHHQTTPVILGEPVDPAVQVYAWALNTYRHYENSRQMISRVMGDLVEHPEIAPDICEEPSCEHAMLSSYLTRMRELGLTTAEFHPDAAAGLLLGAIFTHAMWREYFADPDLPSVEMVLEQFVGLMLSAVGARPSPHGTQSSRAAK
jgi:AcrR family transcriptional regulator